MGTADTNDRSISKYDQIYQDIKEQITQAKLGPGDKLDSESDLMERYSVSSITVRKALSMLAADGCIIRVRGKGSFVNDRTLSASTSLIAVVMPYSEQPDISHLKILHGIQRYLSTNRYSLIVEWYNQHTETDSDAVTRLLTQKLDGLLLYPLNPLADNEMFSHLRKLNLPYVCIDRYDSGNLGYFVGADNYVGGMLAARHFLSLGHRKTAFISENFTLSSERERFDGFNNIMRANGVEELTQVTAVSVSEQLPGRIRERELTGLFCANDRVAIQTIETLTYHGLRVPEDVSIIGFDNWGMLQHSSISLTTVQQDFESLGVLAAKLLVEAINNPALPYPLRYLAPVELIKRETCIPF